MISEVPPTECFVSIALPHADVVSLERRGLAMICGGQGRYANAQNLLSQSARFLVAEDEAKGIVDATRRRVKGTWREIARGIGVSEKGCDRIAGAFAYPGFDL
jgi:serine/threonine-protein kinase HipA